MEDREPIANDARQSSRDELAFGECADEFGADGQRVLNTDPTHQLRDIDRDAKLKRAGERSRHTAPEEEKEHG